MKTFRIAFVLGAVAGCKVPDAPEGWDPRDVSGNYDLTYDNKLKIYLGLAGGAREVTATGYGNIVGQDIGRTPGFGVFSQHAGYRPKKGTLIRGGIDNLFAKTYAEHISRSGAAVSGFTQTTRVNEPGRNLWVKLNIALD